MMYAYNAVLFLFFVPALFVFALRYRRRLRSELFHHFGERLGKWDVREDGDSRPLLWIHCASLGEVRAVEPLMESLAGCRFLLTTITKAGRDYAEKNSCADMVFYAPLDFAPLIRRSLSKVRPQALLIVETELWPGMIAEAQRNGIRVIVINGRMSKQSYPFYRSLRFFWKTVLARVDRLVARSAEDAERFVAAGCSRDRVTISGNIKYDRDFLLPGSNRQDYGIPQDALLLVCGSTREGEEELLLEATRELRKKFPQLRTVIAPRHLNRVREITLRAQELGIPFFLLSRRSKEDAPLVIVDSFGELLRFYAICDVAYVGGSLVSKGGQNPIEPAAFAKPVVFGPHMDNFFTEAQVLETRGGGFRVKDPEDLARAMEKLLSDPSFRSAAGERARAAVESQKGAVRRTAEIVRQTLSPSVS